MRKIEMIADGETVDTIFLFQSEDEREEYFRKIEKEIIRQQEENLANLRRAYMGNKSKIVGAKKIKARLRLEKLSTIEVSYMDRVKVIHSLFAEALSKARAARENSVIEEA